MSNINDNDIIELTDIVEKGNIEKSKEANELFDSKLANNVNGLDDPSLDDLLNSIANPSKVEQKPEAEKPIEHIDSFDDIDALFDTPTKKDEVKMTEKKANKNAISSFDELDDLLSDIIKKEEDPQEDEDAVLADIDKLLNEIDLPEQASSPKNQSTNANYDTAALEARVEELENQVANLQKVLDDFNKNLEQKVAVAAAKVINEEITALLSEE